MEIETDPKLGPSFVSIPPDESHSSPTKHKQHEHRHMSNVGTEPFIPRNLLPLAANDHHSNLCTSKDMKLNNKVHLYPGESPCIPGNSSMKDLFNDPQQNMTMCTVKMRKRSNSDPSKMISQTNNSLETKNLNSFDNFSDSFAVAGLPANTISNFKTNLSPRRFLSRTSTTPVTPRIIESRIYTNDLNEVNRGHQMVNQTPLTGDKKNRIKRSLALQTPTATHLRSPKIFTPLLPIPKKEFETRRMSPLSFWDYLVLEVTNTEFATPKDDKAESVFNMAKIPLELEKVMSFGFLECLDTFLYIFTILPIRLLFGFCLMFKNLITKRNCGLQRLHKADIMKGIILAFTILLLSKLDTSRIYHNIRGQAAMKLYVTFSILEVSDKLCSALGQDIIECLFSPQSLDGSSSKRRNVLRRYSRLLIFLVLGVVYSCVHSMVLLYQIITLNVAVLSYSNALITLLLSNQFSEIKSAVFKKFDRENLFQLTCADIAERFQLWVMLLAIGLRNIVEVGSTGLVPNSWSGWNRWLGAFVGPGFVVLGSEVAVDWLKHSYIAKFNNIRPRVYQKFLAVLVRDHSDHLLSDQIITKRLGLPTIPLACVLARICYQTYHILLENTEGKMFYPAYTKTTYSPTSPYIKEKSSSVLLNSTLATAVPYYLFGNTTANNIINRGAVFFQVAFNYAKEFFETSVPKKFISMSTQFFEYYNLDRDLFYLNAYYYVSVCIFFILLFTLLLMIKLILGLCLFKYSCSKIYRDLNLKSQRENQTKKETNQNFLSSQKISDSLKKREPKGGDFVPGITRGGPTGVIEMDERMRIALYDEGEDIPQRKDLKNKPSLDFLNVERFKMVGKKIW
ncbi:DUF747-domain-containing protein [Nadsonia fulvescens var. elongata DSM 6958]|uniref:DUF747-domain-containing protein n=1 Tax=Nadsonia fulvescens var. elongata DSM 6958 TaxID=857566 RepID=A0A1E3PQT3_9ASCO|nr:DUF747-domain-containing protein [Nadsonia fulvescens var. elongata DSM 6958]